MFDKKTTSKKIITPIEALVKVQKYCAYQERCQREVRDKLYEWGMHKEVVENIIADLINNNFLNEERFAKTYARGKFRIKRWGRNKIKFALKQKEVSAYCIQVGLKEIDGLEYKEAIEKTIHEKLKKKRNPSLKEKYSVANYIISRGFEQDLVWEVLNKLYP